MEESTLNIEGLGEIIIVNNFLNTFSTEEKTQLRKASLELIFQGNFVPHFLFGGSAMRLGLGTMYFINIIELVDNLIDAVDKIESPSSWFRREKNVTIKDQQLYESFQGSIIKSLRHSFIATLKKIREQMKINSLTAKSPNLGPSQLIVYKMALENLAQNEGKSKREILEFFYQVPIVIHVNAAIKDRIVRDLCVNSFYGFNPDNIYFMASPVMYGHKMTGQVGKLTIDMNSRILPVGDGEALEQTNIDGEVYKVNSDGCLEKRSGSLLEILEDRNVEIIQAHRINDLCLLDEELSLSIERLMVFKYYSDNNDIDIGFEL